MKNEATTDRNGTEVEAGDRVSFKVDKEKKGTVESAEIGNSWDGSPTSNFVVRTEDGEAFELNSEDVTKLG